MKHHFWTPTRALLGWATIGMVALGLTPAWGQGPLPAASKLQSDVDAVALITGLPKEAGVFANRPGLCLDLGCGEGKLAAEIAQKTKYPVFALAKDDADCAKARQTLDKANLYGTRAAAVAGSLGSLPFPNGYGNLIVTGDYQDGLDLREVLRVLNPNGLAVIGGGPADAGRLKAAADAAGIKDCRIVGNFAIFHGRMPQAVDNWTHYRHGPDNICTSAETAVRPPFRTQWLQGPVSRESHVVGHACLADGRAIYRSWGYPKTPDFYYAWDAFNGTVLWERITRAKTDCYYALVDGVFYTEEGDAIVALDAATGAEKRVYRVAGSGDWLWMAVQEGTIYGLARGSCAVRGLVGGFLCAIDATSGEEIWTKRSPAPVGMTFMTLGGGAVYGCTFTDEAETTGELFALEAGTGGQRWRTPITFDKPMSAPGNRLFVSAGYRDGRYLVWATGRGMAAYDAKNGKLLKEYPGIWCGGPSGGNEMTTPLFVGDRMYHTCKAPRGSYKCVDLSTGADAGTCPKTGCGPGTASANCLYGGGQGFSVTDLATGLAWSLNGVFRSPCVEGPMAANGMLFVMPSHCGCAYAVQGPAMLAPAGAGWKPPAAGADLDARLVRGPAFDVPLAEDAQGGWTCYRGNPGHTGVAAAAPKTPPKLAWQRKLIDNPTLPTLEYYRAIDRVYIERQSFEQLTAPSFGGGLAYVASRQNAVWALDQATGEVRWKFLCGGGVRVTPAYWRGRLLVGSDDGWVYCLDAADGRLAWRFRAAPQDRYVNVAGRLSSAWPVGTGVLVQDGTAYCVAGLLGYDGVCLYALDARTGRPLLARDVGDSSGGGTAGGIMALAAGRLIVPGGSRVASAYDLKTGTRLDLPAGLGGGEAIADGDAVLIGSAGPLAKNSFSFAGVRNITAQDVAPILAAHTIVGETGGYDRGRFLESMLDRAKPKVDKAWSMTLWPDHDQAARAIVLAGEVVLAAGRPCSADGKPLAAGAAELVAVQAGPDGKVLGRTTLPGRILRNSLAVAGGRVFAVTEEGSICCLKGE